MKIHGLQKMTLLDYPEHVAATVFLGGCDFCCPFCHNFELVDGSASPVMDDEEFFSFLEKRQGILDGVCVTGGEPCLRPDLPDFIGRIKALGFKVKLDTNGSHPDMVKELIASGSIDYVAMDIKNSFSKYALTAGKKDIDIDAIKATVALLMEGKVDYEFRTTVVEQYHEASDFEQIGQWIRGAKKYFLQQYVARDTVPDSSLSAPSKEKLEEYAGIIKEYVPNVMIRGI